MHFTGIICKWRMLPYRILSIIPYLREVTFLVSFLLPLSSDLMIVIEQMVRMGGVSYVYVGGQNYESSRAGLTTLATALRSFPIVWRRSRWTRISTQICAYGTFGSQSRALLLQEQLSIRENILSFKFLLT